MASKTTPTAAKTGSVKTLWEKVGFITLAIGFVAMGGMYWTTNKSVEKARSMADDMFVQIGKAQDQFQQQQADSAAKLTAAKNQIKVLQDQVNETQTVVKRIQAIDPAQLQRVLDVMEKPDIKNVADVAQVRRDVNTLAQQIGTVYRFAQLTKSQRDADIKHQHLFEDALERMVQLEPWLREQARTGNIQNVWKTDDVAAPDMFWSVGQEAAERQLEEDINGGKPPVVVPKK